MYIICVRAASRTLYSIMFICFYKYYILVVHKIVLICRRTDKTAERNFCGNTSDDSMQAVSGSL